MSPQMEYLKTRIMALIETTSAQRICDYGCGEGDLIRALKEESSMSLEFVGIDCFSKWKNREVPKDVEGIQFLDKDSLQVEALKPFDLIISSFALHHFQYPISELKNLQNLLDVNGVIYLADFGFSNKNNAEITKNISSFIGEAYCSFQNRYHRHHYTLNEVLDLFKGTDLKILESRSVELVLDSKSIKEDVEHSLKHVNRSLEMAEKLDNTVLSAFFMNLFEFERDALKVNGIEYSSLIEIIGKRFN